MERDIERGGEREAHPSGRAELMLVLKGGKNIVVGQNVATLYMEDSHAEGNGVSPFSGYPGKM